MISGLLIDSNIHMTVPSTTSDAEFPRTPSSNHSSGICRIAYTSGEAGTRTPSPSPENQYSDIFRSNYSSSSEDERMFDGLLENINRDQSTMEDIEHKVGSNFHTHIIPLMICATFLGDGCLHEAYWNT